MPWWAMGCAYICAADNVQDGATVPCSTTHAAHPRIVVLTLLLSVIGSCVNVMQASVHVRTGSRDRAASHHHSTGQGTGGSAKGAQKHWGHTRLSMHLSSQVYNIPSA